MFKTNLLAKHVKLALLASMTVVTPLTANAAEEVNQAEITNDVEVISVTGVRSSLRDAAFLKKSASQIMDAISAEDIGQLPDNNMAEALQRVTGIQINRDDTGSGSGFQVRGLSQNRVEIDGQSMAGSGEDRSNNFGSIDSALFSGVEVIKSPMADMTEGGIGATVRLKSREPLSFKKPTVNINAALKQDVLADDKGNKLAILGADKYDLGDLGEFGVLVNLTRDEANRATHQFGSNWQLASKEQLDGSDIFLNDDGLKINLYRPQNLALQQQEFAEDKYGANLNLQWAINENAQISFAATKSKRTRNTITNKMQINTSKKIVARDNVLSDVFDAPVILGSFDRPIGSSGALIRTCDDDLNNDGLIDGSCYTPAESTDIAQRYILQNGVIESQGSEQTDLTLNAKEQVENLQTYTLSGKFHLSDNLLMETALSTTKSETDEDEVELKYKPNRNGIANYEGEEGEGLNQVANNTSAYFAYNPGNDVPDFGVYSINSDVDAGSVEVVQDALLSQDLYTLERLSPKEKFFENSQGSLSVDFDWTLDGSVFTSVEFGARAAKNDISRREYLPQVQNLDFNRYSIFSWPWRESDQDFDTRRIPDANGGTGTPNQRPDIAFIDQVMANEYGKPDYLTKFLNTTEDFFPKQQDNVNVPQWITFDMGHNDLKQMAKDFFPGRNGNCTLLSSSFGTGGECGSLINLNEPDYVMESALTVAMPSGVATRVNDGYPYLINEETQAAYLKFNFESELGNIPYTGNFGVRYVKTETNSLGVNRQTYTLNGLETKDPFNTYIYQVVPVELENSYSNVLPSGNINFMLQDNMFLRFAVAKTMSRPNPGDLSPSNDIKPSDGSKTIGNPYLEAQLSWNYDVSWEWYMSDINMMSAALFHKELSNFLENVVYTQPSAGDLDNDNQNNDVVVITQKQNGGKGTISGIELSMNHTMDYLPGFLNGFGLQANYTFTDSSQSSGLNDLDGSELSVKDLSENSYNFILFYDKYNFNFRAAYNYRDESYNGPASSSKDLLYFESVDNPFYDIPVYQPYGAFIPVWNDEFSTLDISMSYKYKELRVFLQGTNILNDVNRSYVGLKETTKMLTRDYKDTGAEYVLGFSYNF